MIKFIEKHKQKNEFSKGYNYNYTFLLETVEHVTLKGTKFKLETYGFVTQDVNLPEPNYECLDFYYVKTIVYYNNKLVIGNDGIPGNVKKAKKWLSKETNENKVLNGKGYPIKST